MKKNNEFSIFKEHYYSRKLLVNFAITDLKKTYRGSAIGWAWALVKPMIRILVFWFAFSIGLKGGSDRYGYPFILWLISGLTPWFYISDMITKGAGSLRSYSYLVTKSKFPVSIIPTFMSLSRLFIHCVIVLIVIIMFYLFGYPLDIYFLQLPFYMLTMFLFFTAWGIFSSPLSAISKDFQNLIKSFVVAIFWTSGILWDPLAVDIEWLRKILQINPVTYIVQGYRNVFINKVWFFEDRNTIYFLFFLLILQCLSSKIFVRLRKEIPDVL